MILVWFQHHPRTRLRHRIPCGLQRRGNPSWEQSTMPHGSHNDTEWQWHPPKRRLDSSFSRKHHLLPCYELMYLFLRKIWRVLWKLDRHQPPVHSMSTYIPKCHLKRTSILFTTHILKVRLGAQKFPHAHWYFFKHQILIIVWESVLQHNNFSICIYFPCTPTVTLW